MHSRRDFGRIVLAGVPLALAKIDSIVNGVQLGVQTYSFRDLPRTNGDAIDGVIKAMTEAGLGECELFAPQVEPRLMMGLGAGGRREPGGAAGGPGGGPNQPGGGAGAPGGGRRRANSPEAMKARNELRQWRLTTPLEHFKAIRQKFDDAGIKIFAYNLSFNDSFTDVEIDRGFEMAKALGVSVITASTTLPLARRVAPFAEKHKTYVAMHGHSNLTDPNEFAKPESFEAAMDLSKYFKINLDIGHFTAAGYDAVAYIQQNHQHITNLHLKDRKKDQGPNVPWGEGDTPIKEVLLLLKETKRPIPAYIEYEYRGTGTPEQEVRKCFEYAKKILA